MVSRSSRAAFRRVSLLPWLLLALMALASVAGAPPPTAWARLFFVLVLLGGLLAAAALIGHRAQVGLAVVLLTLVVGQRVLTRPVDRPPSSQWTAAIQGPNQQVRQVVKLPVGTPEWDRWWQRAVSAGVYICARSPLAPEDGLLVEVNGQRIATLTQQDASGPFAQVNGVGFYRVPVARSLLEAQEPTTIVLRRAPGATDRPIDVCGTFSYRPTAGLESSARFDGQAWWYPGLTQRGRFIVELRLEAPDGRPIVALY